MFQAMQSIIQSALQHARFLAPTSGTERADGLSLDEQTVVRFRARRGTHVECTSGQAWLTVDGEYADFVLDAGQLHDFQERANACVTAWHGAAVRLVDAR
jgi:hypothetical protein